MVVRGTRSSLARARMIRNARRSRRGKTLSSSTSRTSSSRTNSSSSTQGTSQTQQTKKIAKYEEVQKAADSLQKTVKSLVDLDAVATTTTATTSTTATKTEEEQKKEIIAGVKELVEQYNVIYENLEDIGGSVNTIFMSQLKKLVGNCEEELKKTGVTMNKDGTLSVTSKTLEAAELSTLKEVYCKSSGLTAKLSAKCESIEENAASTIQVMNRMYGTQTYNKYGTGSTYYGSSGSLYSALG